MPDPFLLFLSRSFHLLQRLRDLQSWSFPPFLSNSQTHPRTMKIRVCTVWAQIIPLNASSSFRAWWGLVPVFTTLQESKKQLYTRDRKTTSISFKRIVEIPHKAFKRLFLFYINDFIFIILFCNLFCNLFYFILVYYLFFSSIIIQWLT